MPRTTGLIGRLQRLERALEARRMQTRKPAPEMSVFDKIRATAAIMQAYMRGEGPLPSLVPCPTGYNPAEWAEFMNAVERHVEVMRDELMADRREALPVSRLDGGTALTLNRAAEFLQKTPGVQDVLALTEYPFSLIRNRPCLVVRLTPKGQRDLGREQIAGKVRDALRNQIPEAVFRLSIPSTADIFPVYGFPI